MKILHVCLACFYVEGMGYQENLLPQFHAEMGHQVSVLTSDYSFNNKYETTAREQWDYTNEYGVRVKVLGKAVKYGDFQGVYEALEEMTPDVIFVHGGQFVALKDVVKYCKLNRQVKLYIDQHADYYNTPVNNLKRRLQHYFIYGHWMRKAAKYAKKFWGVTPWRCEYLRDVYKLPADKIDLLVMGGDDRYIRFDKMPGLRQDVRERLGLAEDDFVLVTGGKIDRQKNIHLLMQAVNAMKNDRVKLVVFGQPNDEMAPIIDELSNSDKIRRIGWVDSRDVYDYFLAADLAVFPGTHSVLWEQSCACGIPGLFKSWAGMQHVNVNGSAKFLSDVTICNLISSIEGIIGDEKTFSEMRRTAGTDAVKYFSYRAIAKRAIGQD